MNLDLAAMYGTPGAESAIEEQEKIAQAELFAKLAADNGIDLNQLGDEQIAELWDGTFGKTAGDDKDEDDDEDDKSKKAAAEFYAVKEAHDKVAEADYLGRVMAHSFTSEMEQIKEADEKASLYRRGSKAVGEHLERVGNKIRRNPMGDMEANAKINKRVGAGAYAAGAAAAGGGAAYASREKKAFSLTDAGHKFDASTARARQASNEGHADAEREYSKDQPLLSAMGGGIVRAPMHMVGARHDNYVAKRHEKGENAYNPFGGLLTKTDQEKKGSALDSEAAEYAFQKAAEAGWDVNEASERLTAVLTLGPLESEKIASASTYGEALEVRSLELLAQAGYPVQWA